MKIAVVQMEIRDGDPETNRRTVTGYLDHTPGCDLYLLPELWTSGYMHRSWGTIAGQDTPATMEWMGRQAAERGIFLGGSIISEDSDGGLVNRFVLFDREGKLACRYDKSHLFKPLEEHEWLQAGLEMPPVVVIDGFRVSPAICYDLRFPEMFRRIALEGVDLFLVASEWPVPREHVLRVLSECRAIENQAILALSNRIGADLQGNLFCGDSGVFGPTGAIADAGQSRGVTVADVDLKTLLDSRRFLGVFDDRARGIDYL